MYGRKDPRDEGVYTEPGAGRDVRIRYAATRQQLKLARSQGRTWVTGAGGREVEVERAWMALLADDRRLERR